MITDDIKDRTVLHALPTKETGKIEKTWRIWAIGKSSVGLLWCI